MDKVIGNIGAAIICSALAYGLVKLSQVNLILFSIVTGLVIAALLLFALTVGKKIRAD